MNASRWSTKLVIIVGLLCSTAVAAAQEGGDLALFGGFPGYPPYGTPSPTASDAAARTAKERHLRVIAHVPTDGFNADVVAHRGFAYLGSWGNLGPIDPPGLFCPSQGVRVYDLQDPAQPTPVSTFADGASEPDVAGTWTEKVIVQRVHTRSFRGDLAVVSFQNCLRDPATFRGFGLYDVTDPAHPRRLALYRSEPQTQGSHEIWLESRHRSAYVYTAIILSELSTAPDPDTPGRADFRIIDVSDPANPIEVSEWGAWRELDVRPIITDPSGVVRTHFVHSVIVDREIAYLSYWDLGTVMLDVSDPTSPTFLGRTEFAPQEEGNAHSAAVGRRGRLLIQTDEDFDPRLHPVLEQAWGYARLFDILDPANPVPLSTVELASTRPPPPDPGFFSVHDPKIDGNLVYFSWYAEGVVVVRISDPRNPRVVAQFVPPPAPDPFGFFLPGEAFPNVWGVFPHRQFILASDINSGLWVLQLGHEVAAAQE